jgi:hypothetical protein
MPTPNLVLRRRISTCLGARSLKIEDTVCNDSFVPVPHMLLYHVNFGFPVIAPGTRLELDAPAPTPRDAAAAAGLAEFGTYAAPDPDFKAQVFFHDPRPTPDGMVTARLRGPAGPAVFVRYRAAELPAFTQWKMTQAGVYVSALEPCTTHEGPRALRRAQGRLRDLGAGEEIHYQIEVGVE